MGGTGQGVLRLIRAPRVLWIPVAIAALVQALLFFTLEPEIAFDSASYMAQAESIASTGTARNDRGEPDTVRTPGYPVFLAAFLAADLGYPGAIAAQHLLWVILVAATTFSTFRLSGSVLASVVTGLIMAIDLPALQATNAILTETWATVFVTATVWQTHRAIRSRDTGHAVMAGLLAGFTAFIRPVAMLLGVALAAAVWITGGRECRARVAASLIVASLIIPAAWIVRNQRQTGVTVFSSISRINLLMYRAAGTLAIRDPGSFDANITRRQQELEVVVCREAEARFRRPCADIPITERASLYSGLAVPILLADPVGVAMQLARAFVMIMFGGGANMMSTLTGISESTGRVIALVYTAPLALLAMAGVGFWRRIDRAATWIMLLTIAYLVFMSLGAEAYSRFRVPFLPLYAMLAGGGAAMLLDRAGARRS